MAAVAEGGLSGQKDTFEFVGTLALRTRKVPEWDAAAMRVTNEASVNQFVDPAYRAPWKLPNL